MAGFKLRARLLGCNSEASFVFLLRISLLPGAFLVLFLIKAFPPNKNTKKEKKSRIYLLCKPRLDGEEKEKGK